MKITFEEAFRSSYELAQKYGDREEYVWRDIAHDYQKEPEAPYGTWLIMGGRGSGKQLDLRTPVPTPSGWTTMGALRVGDVVFDERGLQCRVTAVTEPKVPNRAFRLHFSDKTHIDACEDHLWVTHTHAERKNAYRSGRKLTVSKPPQTTAELFETQVQGKRGDRNHSIPVAGPLDSHSGDLPLDPYILGFWLGDGCSAEAAITVSDSDAEFALAQFQEFRIGKPRRKPGANCATYPILHIGDVPPRDETGRTPQIPSSLTYKLKAAGVHKNKHIPPKYLRASVGDRLNLLRGLMDTDGYADPTKNTVEFCSCSERLARGVLELARSLSQKPVLTTGNATIDGRVVGVKYRVCWRPTIDVFRMPRKCEKISFGGPQYARSLHRMIVKIEEIPPAPMCCITVDSPNSMYLAGEGMVPTHNTRTGAEMVNEWARSFRGYGLLVGRSAADVRGTMLEGESGLLTLYPDILYEPSKRRLTWPNGTQAECLYAESPNSLRGPQGHWAWADEIAAWEDADQGDSKGTAWNNLTLATRLGKAQGWRPRKIATTTPKATKLLVDILAKSNTLVTSGSTYANRDNLADEFLADIEESYKGTRLEEQEIHGKLVLDSPAALWTEGIIDATRVISHPNILRTVVGVDPAASDGETAAETAIIVAGVGEDGHYYVLKDLSMKGKPMEWAKVVVLAARQYNAARVVCEKNNGGLMVQATIDAVDRTCPTHLVWASDGKEARAEPISLLYEKGLVHHVGHFPDLERQMVSWEPRKGMKSPDRLDGLVWALTDLKANNYGAPKVHKRFEQRGDADREERRRRFGMRRLV